MILYDQFTPPGREGGDELRHNDRQDLRYQLAMYRGEWLTYSPRSAVRQNGYSVLTALAAPIPTVQDSMIAVNRTTLPSLQRYGLLAAPGTGGQGT